MYLQRNAMHLLKENSEDLCSDTERLPSILPSEKSEVVNSV